MKTIYEYLKECNREEVADAYIYNYEDSMSMIPKDCNLTPWEIKERFKKKINEHIDFLLSHTPKPDKDSVLLAYHIIPTRFGPNDDIEFDLVNINEPEEDGVPRRYSFEFSPTEEILGYYVSDAYTTQYHLEDLLAWFLNESSFFGWERERVEDEVEELVRRADEVKSGKAETVSAEEVFKSLREEHEWSPEERNPDEKKRENEIYQEIWKYNMENLKREISYIKKKEGDQK